MNVLRRIRDWVLDLIEPVPEKPPVNLWRAAPRDHFAKVREHFDAAGNYIFKDSGLARLASTAKRLSATMATGPYTYVQQSATTIEILDRSTGATVGSFLTGLAGMNQIAISPNGRYLCVSYYTAGQVALIDLTTNTSVLTGTLTNANAIFATSGYFLVTANGSTSGLWVNTTALTTTAVTFTANVNTDVIFANGNAYYATGTGTIEELALGGTTSTAFVTGLQALNSSGFAADATYLYYYGQRASNSDIYVYAITWAGAVTGPLDFWQSGATLYGLTPVPATGQLVGVVGGYAYVFNTPPMAGGLAVSSSTNMSAAFGQTVIAHPTLPLAYLFDSGDTYEFNVTTLAHTAISHADYNAIGISPTGDRVWVNGTSTFAVLSTNPLTAVTTYAGAGYGSLAVSPVSTSAPAAPTLTAPANASYQDVSAGVTLTATYNSTDAATQNAYALRVKTSGGSYLYWNAGTSALQSSIVWNAITTAVGGSWSVVLGAGILTNGNIYNWSMASQESGGSLQGPFATDSTFTAQAPGSAVVTAPTGTVTTTTEPTVSWSDTLGSGSVQTNYQVIVESGAFTTSPGSGTQAWSSGVVSGAATSAVVGVALSPGVTYRAFVQITETGGILSPWAYTTFTMVVEVPAVPTVVGTPGTDPSTGAPVVTLTVEGNDNQLTLNQSDLSSGLTTGWSSGANTDIAVSSAWAITGSSLVLAAVAAGAVSAYTPVGTSGVPVTPGKIVRAMAFFASALSRSCDVAITFYNAAGAVVSTVTSTAVASVVGGEGAQAFFSVTVPATAASASMTLNASGLAAPNATLATALTSGTAYTSLAVTALVTAINSGDHVVLVSNGNTQTFVASASAAIGATAISVNSLAANFSYPIGTLVDPDLVYANQMLLGPSNFASGLYGYDQLVESLGPTAWWKMADAPGSTTVADSSGNGYTGTVSGTTNLLTAPNDSFETGVGSWTDNGNATLAQSSIEALVGTHSLSLTAIAAGQVSAISNAGNVLAVSPSTEYTAVASYRAAATAQSVRTDIAFFTSAGGFISEVLGTVVTDSASGWTQAIVTTTSPSNAAYASIAVYITTPAAIGEVHYVDCVGLFQGTNTSWVPAGQPAGVQFGQTGPITGTPSDTAALFDGSTGYISTAFNPSGAALSVVGWIKTPIPSFAGMVVSSSNESTVGVELSVNSSGHFGVTMGNGATTSSMDAGLIADLTWRQFAVTFDGSTIRSYIDGAAGPTIALAGSIAAGPLLRIGSYQGFVGDLFPGAMSELKFFPSALTAAQVLALYNAAPQAANPEYQWSAGGFVGSTVANVTFSDDGVNYFPVRNGTNVALPPATQSAAIPDYEGPLGFTRQYQAQVVSL